MSSTPEIRRPSSLSERYVSRETARWYHQQILELLPYSWPWNGEGMIRLPTVRAGRPMPWICPCSGESPCSPGGFLSYQNGSLAKTFSKRPLTQRKLTPVLR